MRVQQDWNQDDRVAEQDGDQRLPPVHAGADQSRRQHVSRNAVRHADPERGIVIGRPIAVGNFDRREVAIKERTGADFLKRLVLEFDASVGILDKFRCLIC